MVMQAAPRYEPSADECSDFKLRVMAQVHQIHEDRKLERMARMMGAGDG